MIPGIAGRSSLYSYLRLYRLRFNQFIQSSQVDHAEIIPLLAIMTGGTLWASYFYSRKWMYDLDSSEPDYAVTHHTSIMHADDQQKSQHSLHHAWNPTATAAAAVESSPTGKP